MALPLALNQYGATIAAGQSLSSGYTYASTGGVSNTIATGGVAMGADTLAAIQMPAVWTAAGITFQVSPDGGTTWCELYDDAGNEVTITSPAAGSFILLNAHPSYEWRGVNLLKVRSGTAAAPVPQVAAAIVTLIGRPEIF